MLLRACVPALRPPIQCCNDHRAQRDAAEQNVDACIVGTHGSIPLAIVTAVHVSTSQVPTPNAASDSENEYSLKNCPKMRAPAAKFAMSASFSASSIRCALLNSSIVVATADRMPFRTCGDCGGNELSANLLGRFFRVRRTDPLPNLPRNLSVRRGVAS